MSTKYKDDHFMTISEVRTTEEPFFQSIGEKIDFVGQVRKWQKAHLKIDDLSPSKFIGGLSKRKRTKLLIDRSIRFGFDIALLMENVSMVTSAVEIIDEVERNTQKPPTHT